MTKTFYFAIIISLLIFKTANGQNQNVTSKEKIAVVFENYFDLEREAIHLHLDKTIFINNETVWFKGYVINRKTGKPFFTTNIFILLFDEKGNQLSEQLVFGNSGYFQGKIKLNPNYKSGNYYIQAYTNWMNNFGEDESTLVKINIINSEEGYKDYKTANKETLSIQLHPEGGNLIHSTTNNLGIEIKDCRGNSIPNLEGSLQTMRGEIVKTFSLNKFGLGKIEITPTNQELKIVIPIDNNLIEKKIPSASYEGFSLSANAFSVVNKTLIEIKTNKQTLTNLKDKKIYFVINQDEKTIIEEIDFNNSFEKTISLDNTKLFKGINTISIIDEDLKKWCGRIIYINEEDKKDFRVVKNKNNGGNTTFVGYSDYHNSNISLSVLPQLTKSLPHQTPLLAGIRINPYINTPLDNGNYYLNETNRIKLYELDLVLLNQEKEKYDFTYMAKNPPASKYSFDIGITLKGRIDENIKDKTFTKVKLKAQKELLLTQSDVSEKGDYLFEHIVFGDSTFVEMALERLPNFEKIETQLRPTILNRNRTFNHPFRINIPEGCSIENAINMDEFELPEFNVETITLKGVVINNKFKKKPLIHANDFGNANLRAYKIDDSYQNSNLLLFIETNGFTVQRNGGAISIFSRQRTSLRGAQSTPAISVNNRRIFSAEELDIISMHEVDEIYLNPYVDVPGIQNLMGVIKIYLKTNKLPSKTVIDSNKFYIDKGYSRIESYSLDKFKSIYNEGFDNLGILNWCPAVLSDETGQFQFETTTFGKEKAKIVLEGLNNDGDIIHKEIDLKL